MICIYIYIYIYYIIYIVPQTDFFVVSQLFNVARHVGRIKLGSKPAQLYVRLSIIIISSVRLFTFYTLPDARVLNSLEEHCILRAAAENSFARLLNPHGGAYIIVMHRHVSQIFSVARHVGHLKLGSKPAQLYVRLSIRPLGQQAYHVGKGIIRYYVATAASAFVCLHFIPYRTPECSIRSNSFVLCERQL